jgi:SAM-dependent methyltransferase
MSATDTGTFFKTLSDSITAQQFIKLTLSDRRDKSNNLKNIFVKPVVLKSGFMLSFVYRHPTKDITKNYETQEGTDLLKDMLEKGFYKADLFTTTNDLHLTLTKNGKSILTQKTAANQQPPVTEHDKTKKRYVIPENNIYLRELGITTAEGKVKSDKQDKFRQINKYVEIVEGIVHSASLSPDFSIADMGAGKGYLTFALYDYLTNSLHMTPKVTGVEMRKELVENCNNIAAKAGFNQLNFITGSIDTAEIPATDMLIALHACDTATDQAIYRGITSGAKVIICAPCCHKQIRKSMKPANDIKAITKYGILEERQAEILTDAMRALILEAFGYQTKVFEFISTEHTPKNIMIVGVKTEVSAKTNPAAIEQLKILKAMYNIEYHQLEKLMNI